MKRKKKGTESRRRGKYARRIWSEHLGTIHVLLCEISILILLAARLTKLKLQIADQTSGAAAAPNEEGRHTCLDSLNRGVIEPVPAAEYRRAYFHRPDN